MTAVSPGNSPYEQRVAIVQNVVSTNTDLGDDASRKLAVQILEGIDELPEKMS